MQVRKWIASLLVAASLLSGCGVLSAKSPSVESVTLTDKVEERTKAPLSSLNTFPQGSKVLYASVKVVNPRKDTKLEAVWYYDGKPVDTAEVVFDSNKDRYAAFSLVATDTFPSGEYKVEISLDGKPVQSLSFHVE